MLKFWWKKKIGKNEKDKRSLFEDSSKNNKGLKIHVKKLFTLLRYVTYFIEKRIFQKNIDLKKNQRILYII